MVILESQIEQRLHPLRIKEFLTHTIRWTPVWGVIVFVILYVIATLYYPGGSPFNQATVGFSWTENYWCNLLNDQAINGQPNGAQPIAMVAMVVLCLTLFSFWWQFPKRAHLAKAIQLTIQLSGALAVLIGFLLFTSIDHDLITNLASLFGLIATLGTLYGLYKNRWMPLFYFGLVNMLLVILNNLLYYNPDWIVYLPIVQKVTFGTFLGWVVGVGSKG